MNSSCFVPWFSYTHGCLSVSFSIMLGHSHKLLIRTLTPCCLNLPITGIPSQINLFFLHPLPGIGYFVITTANVTGHASSWRVQGLTLLQSLISISLAHSAAISLKPWPSGNSALEESRGHHWWSSPPEFSWPLEANLALCLEQCLKMLFVLRLITADRPFCCQLRPELGILPYILSGLCSQFFFLFFFNQRLAPII